MTRSLLILATGASLLVALNIRVAAVGQDPTIKLETAPYTSPVSGEEMFKSYCAGCHGADAQGSGPAAPALKVPAADLTHLATAHGGKFPAIEVRSAMDGHARGSRQSDMPDWNRVFQGFGDHAQVAIRLHALTNYVASVQAK